MTGKERITAAGRGKKGQGQSKQAGRSASEVPERKAGLLERRGFVRGLSAAAVSGPFIISRAAAARRPPNIVFITADDLGWKDLGCYGNREIKTPNLDRLAEQGVRFTNAFVTAPSCSASRASFITGQAPHSVHLLGLTHVHPRYQLSPSIPTLPRALRAAGYATALHGKWHVAPFRNPMRYGYQYRLDLSMMLNHSWKAKAFISAHKQKPFYLELNFMQTHRPVGHGHYFQVDKDFPVSADEVHVPEYWQVPDWPEIREDVAGYYSQARKMDHLIGEILDHLDREGLAENTLVIFVSDNGPPYPGCKMTLYDRGIGTPLILRWPAALPQGAVVDELASTVDIMPTCLEAAAAACPPQVQGRSLLSLARREEKNPRAEVFAELTYHVIYSPMRAVRTREWKYIENLSPDPVGLDQCKNMEWAKRAAKLPGQRCCRLRPPEELYCLSRDPNEQENLAESPEYQSIKKQLRETLHEWRERTSDPFPDLS